MGAITKLKVEQRYTKLEALKSIHDVEMDVKFLQKNVTSKINRTISKQLYKAQKDMNQLQQKLYTIENKLK